MLHRPMRQLAVSVLLIAGACVVTVATWPFFAGTPFFLFFIAAMLGALWGDTRATVLSVALAVVVPALLLPRLHPGAVDAVRLAVFAVLVAAGAWFATTQRARGRTLAQVVARLRDSEERYRRLIADDLTGVYVSTAAGQIADCNQAFADIFGFADVDDARACPAAALYPVPAERERFLAGLREHRRFERAEATFRRRDGTLVHVVQNVVGEFDAAGELVAMHGYMFDVTARRRAEAALAESHAMLRAVIGSAPIVLWALDRDGVFTLSEGKGLDALGLRPGEVVGRSAFDVYRDVPSIVAHTRRALAGEASTEIHAVGLLHFESWYSALRDADGAITGAIGVAIDVTERTRLEAQLRHDQRMKAVGQLAGGIAHDFNNLLTAILGYGDMLLARTTKDHPDHDDLENIQSAARSAAALTRQLLAFSRRQVIQPRSVNLNDVVQEMAALLHRVIGEPVTLVTDLAPDLAPIWADPAQLQQVVLNLAVNARDAMPAGGTLTIMTDNVTLDEAYALRHGIAPVAGAYIRLSVSDTGIGMDAETQARIFEPFFTTKPIGQGTGLGMATVYGVVKQAGGYVWVYSELRRGTVFRIYLPVEREGGRLVAAAPEESRPDVASGTETILLVEDEDSVRRLGCRALRAFGYTVLDAAGAEEALARIREHAGPLDLVITDVVLHGLSGPQLAVALARERPHVPVLFVSGYAEHHLTKQGVLSADVWFLEKPFTASQLAAKVREVLDGPEPRGANP